MLRGERRAYRRGTATGHLSTRHDLTSFHASSSSLQGCPRVKHDDETADRNSVEEEEEEKEGEKDLSPSIRQSVGPPAKLRAIVVNRNRFLARFTPTPFQRSPSNGFVLLGLPFLPRHFEKAAARVGGKHASPATFGLRKLRWPLLRIREEREEVSVHCFYQPRSNAEETEVWATVAEETVAKFETRGFAPARDFRISDVGILTSAGRGGDSRHVATGGTREKERDEGRGKVSAIVWRLINLG